MTGLVEVLSKHRKKYEEMNYRELPLIQLYTYDMHSHGLN